MGRFQSPGTPSSSEVESLESALFAQAAQLAQLRDQLAFAAQQLGQAMPHGTDRVEHHAWHQLVLLHLPV